MDNSFIKLLESIKFMGGTGVPNTYVKEEKVDFSCISLIEEKLKGKLNPSYLRLIKELGIIELEGESTNLNFLSLEDILEEGITDIGSLGDLYNIFVFGVDNGGYFYFFDQIDRYEKGKDAIYHVSPSNPFWDDVQHIGSSLKDVMEKIIAGEEFSTSPSVT